MKDVSIILPIIESVFTALGTTIFFFYSYIKKEFITKAVFYNERKEIEKEIKDLEDKLYLKAQSLEDKLYEKIKDLENKVHEQSEGVVKIATKIDFIVKSIEDLSKKIDKLRGGK